jgi:hypothetical protein
MKQGGGNLYYDWDCPQCNQKNIHGINDKCPSCRCFRSKAFKKPGDWDCSCGSSNFGSRSACYKCNKPRVSFAKKPGDWDCSCGVSNFSSRLVCFKCGKPKQTLATEDSDAKLCKICFERDLEASIPCGHICMCFVCAVGNKTCPICRAAYDPEKDIKKVFIV